MKWPWDREFKEIRFRLDLNESAINKLQDSSKGVAILVEGLERTMKEFREGIDALLRQDSAKIDAMTQTVSKLKRVPEPKFNIPAELQDLPVDWERMGIKPIGQK